MADKKISELTAISSQVSSDLYETSANGTGSFKETRAQQTTYWNNNLFTPANTAYAAINGSNSTGTGNYLNPYADPFAASNALTGSTSNPKLVMINSGNYSTTSFSLKPNVSLFGNRNSILTVTNPIVLDASWGAAAAGSITYLNGIQSTNGIQLDFSTYSFGGLNPIWLMNCQFGDTSIFTGTVGHRPTINIENCKITNLVLSGVTANIFGLQAVNTLIVEPSAGDGFTNVTIKNSDLPVALTIIGDNAGHVFVTIQNCTNISTLIVSTTYVSLVIDEASYPVGGITYSSGAVSSQVTVQRGDMGSSIPYDVTAGKMIRSNGANYIPSTATYPDTGGASGSVIISDGTNKITSTSLWPNTVGSAGKIIRSDGTTNAYTTSTFADTYSASNLLYSNGANTVTGLATANSAHLVTNSSGVPVMTATMTNGQLVIGSTGATPTPSTLTAGSGISITNGAGSITIAAAAPATNINSNILIGGNFSTNPWQRGITFNSTANSTYTADRFKWQQAFGSGVVNITKASDSPTAAQAGVYGQYCLSIATATADASIGSTDQYALATFIEGPTWAQYAQNAMTLSFWVKSTKTGTFCVSCFNNGDRTFIAEYTISVTNTWEYKTISIPASPSAGSWTYAQGTCGLTLTFTIAAGSNFQGSTGWNTTGSGLYCTSNQVNGMDSNSNVFLLQYIKLEQGSSATNYPLEDLTTVYQLCQRYYETSQSFESGFYFPNTDQTGGNNWTCPAAGTGAIEVYIPFKVRKAIVPTITLCDNLAATGKVYKGAAGKTANSTGIGQYGFNGGTSDATNTNTIYFQYQAVSEIG